jgi:hypothetical protein
MKTFLAHLRDIAISFFFALFPVYVLFLVIRQLRTSSLLVPFVLEKSYITDNDVALDFCAP